MLVIEFVFKIEDFEFLPISIKDLKKIINNISLQKNKNILDLNKDQLNTLYKACAGHTGGINPSSDTIACCWDADRLDIRRVGANPDLQLFNTDAAKGMVTNKNYSLIDN